MDPAALGLVVVVMLIASTAQTVTGFGFALIAVPCLAALLDVKDVVVLVSVLALVNSSLLFLRTRAHVPARTVAIMLAGSLAGMPAGLAVLLISPGDVLRIIVGVASIAMALALAAGSSLRMSGVAGELTAGVASGVLNTSTSMNGPPVVLYLQDAGLPPMEFRAALATFFSISGVLSLGAFAATGIVTLGALALAAAGLPMVVAGNWIGHALFQGIDRLMFRRIVLALLAVTALAAVTSSAVRMAA